MASPGHLYFTENDEANALIATDPFAFLVGFALDQQITVQQAFAGPLRIKQRVGTLDPRLRGRKADALERLLDQTLEPFDRKREMRAALRARDRVHLVDDQRVDAP